MLALVLPACGTRLSHSEVVQSAGQSARQTGATSDTGATAGSGEGVGEATSGTDVGSAAGSAGTSSGGRAAAGAGSSAGPARAGAASAAPGATAGAVAPGADIVIGTVGNFSGPAGAAYSPTGVAVQVWARMINDRGGLLGHHIRVIVRDDGGDPARHQATLQELAEHDKVIAFVGNAAVLSGQAGRSYYESQKVPLIGGDLSFPFYTDSPMVFPQGTTFNSYFYGILANGARLTNKKRLGLITCVEAQACRDAARAWPGDAKQLGLQVVFQAQISITQPSFTAECLRARQAGVELLAPLVDPTALPRLANSCAQQGFHPTLLMAGPQHSPEQDGVKNMEGTLSANQTFPQMVSDTEGAREFHAAFERYAPGTKLYVTHSLGWTSAKLFQRGAEIAGEPLNRERLVAALRTIKNDNLGGAAPALNLSVLPHEVKCWFLMKFQGGKWTAPEGSKTFCP